MLGLSRELGCGDGLSYEVHASVGSTMFASTEDGAVPLALPMGCGEMKAGSTLFRACPLHPCTAGVLDCKAAVPGAKEPGSLPSVPVHCPSPESHSLWAAVMCLLLQASRPALHRPRLAGEARPPTAS